MTEQPDKSLRISKRRIVLVTGMSGAGLSSALKAFEDLGYEAVDNLRIGLIPALIDDSDHNRPLAVAADMRNANFSPDDLLRALRELSDRRDLEVKLLYLECSDETLQQRFNETGRSHPLAVDRPVTDGIKRE